MNIIFYYLLHNQTNVKTVNNTLVKNKKFVVITKGNNKTKTIQFCNNTILPLIIKIKFQSTTSVIAKPFNTRGMSNTPEATTPTSKSGQAIQKLKEFGYAFNAGKILQNNILIIQQH